VLAPGDILVWPRILVNTGGSDGLRTDANILQASADSTDIACIRKEHCTDTRRHPSIIALFKAFSDMVLEFHFL
jgi:hypothetical protein